MEVDDPISTKFQTLIESLMAKTTSEIVKVFAEVLLETRVEITRSWREIDELKQKLEESEEQRAETVLRSQGTCSFKRETEEVPVSDVGINIAVSETSTVCPMARESKDVVQTPEDATSEKTVVAQTSVEVHEPVTSQAASPGTSGINSPVNSPNPTQEAQDAQESPTPIKRKRGRPPKLSTVTEHQKSTTENKAVSPSPVQTDAVLDPQQPSCSTGITILGKKSCKRAVLTKKSIQRKLVSTGSGPTTHTLRDRQLLSNQRSCLCCCSSDQCSMQEKKPKINPEVVPRVYTCNRCGKIFKNLRYLTAHRRSVRPSHKPFPYCCYLCGHMFATQCGWILHKRIHSHSNLAEAQEDIKPFQLLTLPKELKAKVQVRLERISDAQLEAALFPKGSLLQSETPSMSSADTSQNLPSTLENQGLGASPSATSADTVISTPVLNNDSQSQTMAMSVLDFRSESESGENTKQSDDHPTDFIPTASGQIQATNSSTVPAVSNEDCEEGSSGASDESGTGLNSLSRKRKMSDCDHDVHNGVFPVEKILRWRNTKGRNEVRVKWMPCSLCGAKWKNTWEPAESFISYKDNKNEEPGRTNTQD
ncbi:uncharacterized protein [Salminus brasiliensis]|uniref:uncharacterized protein isoform X2 n=1 Tax=Salminus brasiliensis TaxID=930266 RepID=UPI003B836273